MNAPVEGHGAIGQDEFALKALMVAEEEIKYNSVSKRNVLSKNLEVILKEIDVLKAKLDNQG